MFSVPLQCTCTQPPPEVSAVFQETDNAGFLAATLGHQPKIVYQGEDTTHVAQSLPQFETAGTDSLAPNLLLHTLHQAQLTHAAVELSPEMIWYIIVHQFAQYQRYSGPIGHLGRALGKLTERPLKVTVYGDLDWRDVVGKLFREMLMRLPGDLAWEATARSSSYVDTADIASIAALFGGPNPHRPYQPQTGSSHIARVNLGGEISDWERLHARTGAIQPHVNWGYRLHVGQVLDSIMGTMTGRYLPRPNFWELLYVYTKDGGNDRILGWITELFGHDYGGERPRVLQSNYSRWYGDILHQNEGRGRSTGSFPSLVSAVPFILSANDGKDERHMTLLAGVTGVERNEGVLKPTLGLTIVED